MPQCGILLKLVATVSANAHKRFVMKDHLQSANIGRTGDNFKRVMLEKIEEDIPAGDINIHQLEKSSLDPEIMVEIGPERRIVPLAHFIERLEKQAKEQLGGLKTDGFANVAYILGTDGNIWAMNANWNEFSRYWFVEACSPGYPLGWRAGYQFLSRK